jgi:hypothetical protein
MLSYKYYLNTVTRTVSKHTATFLSCYHINITLTQQHVPLHRAATHPVFSLCAVTRHNILGGKFCDLLHDNGLGFVRNNRAFLFPPVVDREGGGSALLQSTNRKFNSGLFVYHQLFLWFPLKQNKPQKSAED